jgi:voltage-gated potassium channel
VTPVDTARRQQAFEAVERITEIPMIALSVAMLPLLLAPLVFDLSATTEDALFAADWAIWAIFALELGVKTYLAPARGPYLRTHWFDVVIVVVPFLRPLRIVRSARAFRGLRAIRLFSFMARTVHSTRSLLSEHGLQYVLLVGVLLLFASAGLIALFESGSEGTIQGFDDGLWWAVTTITTVGYGDKFPVTPEGKGIAVFLMLVGIALFSLITANLAAFLVQPKEDQAVASLDEVLEALRRLEAKVDELQRRDT